jgi:hypothetical protein
MIHENSFQINNIYFKKRSIQGFRVTVSGGISSSSSLVEIPKKHESEL